MIELKNLQKTYQGDNGSLEALRGVSVHVREGEIYGVIGKSGAGKSTLIRCINMLERPTSGSVIVDGEELTTMPERQLRDVRKKIGMIFQHFNLLSSRTVYDNVAFPLELAGKTVSEIEAAVTPLLELVGLADKRNQYPAQLSGGQKQRVGIARALANRPKVLLCDEATSALDPQTTHSILELLKDINQKFNLTIVIITHEMQVIKEICDRVAVIENGLIIEEGLAIDQLRSVLASMAACAREARVAIVTGDTKVVEQGKGDGVFITTTGVGVLADSVSAWMPKYSDSPRDTMPRKTGHLRKGKRSPRGARG